MVVLADEILESFFETDLSASFRLEPVPEMELPPATSGFLGLGDLWATVATDSNKKLFNIFTDEIGKTIGKHQVIQKPSIGRYTKLEEPKARESLIVSSVKHSTSQSNLRESSSSPSVAKPSVPSPSPSPSAPALSTPRAPSPTPSIASTIAPSSQFDIVQAANAALMERTAFAIDDAMDDDDDTDEDLEGANDEDVMDEVHFYLHEERDY